MQSLQIRWIFSPRCPPCKVRTGLFLLFLLWTDGAVLRVPPDCDELIFWIQNEPLRFLQRLISVVFSNLLL